MPIPGIDGSKPAANLGYGRGGQCRCRRGHFTDAVRPRLQRRPRVVEPRHRSRSSRRPTRRRAPTRPGRAAQVLNPDGTIYPSARTFPDLVDAIGHGRARRSSPPPTASPAGTACSIGTIARPGPGGVGVGGVLPRPPPGLGWRSAASTPPFSCTSRTWTSARRIGERPAGELATSRPYLGHPRPGRVGRVEASVPHAASPITAPSGGSRWAPCGGPGGWRCP